jgi:hypothetical protein
MWPTFGISALSAFCGNPLWATFPFYTLESPACQQVVSMAAIHVIAEDQPEADNKRAETVNVVAD